MRVNLPLMAAGVLEQGEADQLAQHLRECSACQTELQEYRALLSSLAVDAVEPDWSGLEPMRQAFSDRLRDDSRPFTSDAAVGKVANARRSAWNSRWGWAAAVLIALGGWGTAYHFHQTAVSQNRVLALMASGTRVALSDSQSGYRAVMAVENNTAVVWAENLPKLPSGHLYEGWWIEDGRPVRAGMFSTAPMVLKVPSRHPREFAVTIEPARGTPQPTTPVLVAGALPI